VSHARVIDRSTKDSGDNEVARHAKRSGTGPTIGRMPLVHLPVQLLPKVSEPGDPLEREADTVASNVVARSSVGHIHRRADEASETPQPFLHRQPDDEVQRQSSEGDETVQGWLQRQVDDEVQRQVDDEVQRQVANDEEGSVQRQSSESEDTVQTLLQRQTAGPNEEEPVQAMGPGPTVAPPVSASTAATIRNPGRGAPVPPAVRTTIEPHLGVSLAGVEVHTGRDAQQAAGSLGARAFTHGSHIYLNRGESPFDLRLMSHEAAHVVQQGAAVQRQLGAGEGEDVQLLPDFILDRLASYARHIPGYTLFTVIIGFNPLNGARVERNAMNLVEGLMGLVPFGTAIFDKLTELGVIQDAFDFIERQLATFDLSLERLERTIEAAWDDMDFIRLDPFDYNIGVLRRHFGALVDDVRGFAGSVVDRIIELIKEAAIGVAEGLLADNAAWDLIKKILHYDPLRGEPVDATTVEILEDFLMLIGKEQELEQMRVRGTLQETADWLDTQFATFMGLVAELGSLFSAAWEAIQPENLPNLMANLESLAGRVVGFLQRVWEFAVTVAVKVLELIKDALLGWLAAVADEVPGFHLITVIIGRNPFTGDEVPRTAANIIRGFISLLPGGNQMYEHLAETGVIAEAAARIEGAIADLGISWEFITGIFLGIWDSLGIDDLIDPIGAFQRIVARFGEPISRLFRFVRVVLEEVVKLILALMSFPTEILASIISKALQAFEDIKRDPIAFIMNMLAAVKLGFSNFFSNILDHLLAGLVDWLFRGLRDAGIEPPTEITLESILDLVMQVLGITVDRLWEKLAERIGQERVDQIRGAIDRLVGIWNFIRDVQERGVAAIWEYIVDQISGLWDTVLQMAQDWIMERIITRVTARLLSMLDPTGVMAVVNSFIAFFNAVQSAIEYIREILEIVNDYVTTIAAVARGDIEPGAAKMERGLANAIPIAIGFLANQVGLGDIGEKIAEIIEGIRAVIDQALDWLMDQAMGLGEGLLRTLGLGGEEEDDGPQTGDIRDTVRSNLQTLLRGEHSLDDVRAIIASQLAANREHGLTALYLGPEAEDGTYSVVAEASPPVDLATVIPNVAPRGAAVKTFVRLTLAGEAPAFETETLEVEIIPSHDEWFEWTVNEFGRTSDPGEFRRWRDRAIEALTTRETVEVPVGAGVDAAGPELRARARTVRGVRIEGRNYRLVRRVEAAAHGRSRHGGAVFASGENRVDAEFWSVGQLAEGRRGDNSTHAGVQFMGWYRRLDDAVKRRVTHIHLQNQTYSPCWTCSTQLVSFIRSARDASEHNVSADIAWSEPYLEPPRPRSGGETTPGSLSNLAGANWQVSPATLPVQGDVDERFVWGRS